MADRVSTQIKIGGQLSPEQCDTLATMIEAEDLATEWDGPNATVADIVDGEQLALFAHQVSWGTFDALEAWLVAQNLPFVRQCDGFNGSFGGQRVVYRGIGSTLESYGVDEGPNVVVDHDTVRTLKTYEAILAHFEAADFEPGPVQLRPA